MRGPSTFMLWNYEPEVYMKNMTLALKLMQILKLLTVGTLCSWSAFQNMWGESCNRNKGQIRAPKNSCLLTNILTEAIAIHGEQQSLVLLQRLKECRDGGFQHNFIWLPGWTLQKPSGLWYIIMKYLKLKSIDKSISSYFCYIFVPSEFKGCGNKQYPHWA